MEKNNLKVEQLKLDILQLMSKVDLPIATVYYLMKDLTQDLEKTYYNSVQKQYQELKKYQKENKEKENQQQGQ